MSQDNIHAFVRLYVYDLHSKFLDDIYADLGHPDGNCWQLVGSTLEECWSKYEQEPEIESKYCNKDVI